MHTTFSVVLLKVGVSVEWDDVEILSFLPSKNIFGVHARVHGPQNRMKIEGSQQLNFRYKNNLGT